MNKPKRWNGVYRVVKAKCGVPGETRESTIRYAIERWLMENVWVIEKNPNNEPLFFSSGEEASKFTDSLYRLHIITSEVFAE